MVWGQVCFLTNYIHIYIQGNKKKTVQKKGVAAKTPVGKGKGGNAKTPVSGGIKKTPRGPGSAGRNTGRRLSGQVSVVIRGGKGIGHGLGPKEGVTRRQHAPPKVQGTSGDSINSRFERIYKRGGASRSATRSRQGGSRRNSYGVVMPL